MMISVTRSLLPLALVLGLAACGADDFEGYLDDVDGELDDLESLVQSHADTVDDENDLRDILDEEDAYFDEARTHHRNLLDTSDMMLGCRHMGGGMPESMMHMRGEISDLGDELAEHRQAMLGASGLEAARSEEASHQDAMGDLLRELREDHSRLRAQEQDFDCGD